MIGHVRTMHKSFAFWMTFSLGQDEQEKVVWDTADLSWWDFQRRRWKTLWHLALDMFDLGWLVSMVVACCCHQRVVLGWWEQCTIATKAFRRSDFVESCWCRWDMSGWVSMWLDGDCAWMSMASDSRRRVPRFLHGASCRTFADGYYDWGLQTWPRKTYPGN